MTSPCYLVGRIEAALAAAQEALDAIDIHKEVFGGAAAERMGVAKGALRMAAADLAELREIVCERPSEIEQLKWTLENPEEEEKE